MKVDTSTSTATSIIDNREFKIEVFLCPPFEIMNFSDLNLLIFLIALLKSVVLKKQ